MALQISSGLAENLHDGFGHESKYSKAERPASGRHFARARPRACVRASHEKLNWLSTCPAQPPNGECGNNLAAGIVI